MAWSEKEMCKHFGHLEDHQYKHFNQALGVQIHSKEHFKELLNKGNYISYDDSCRQVDANKEKQKYNGISEKAKKFCYGLKNITDKKGNVKFTDRLIKGMKKEVGVDYSFFQNLPKHYQTDLSTVKGGTS